MKRIIDVDMECRCKKVTTALDKFFKKYPTLNYWREHLEYMADGTKNNFWSWALHLDIEEDYIYIAVIERA